MNSNTFRNLNAALPFILFLRNVEFPTENLMYIMMVRRKKESKEKNGGE